MGFWTHLTKSSSWWGQKLALGLTTLAYECNITWTTFDLGNFLPFIPTFGHISTLKHPPKLWSYTRHHAWPCITSHLYYNMTSSHLLICNINIHLYEWYVITCMSFIRTFTFLLLFIYVYALISKMLLFWVCNLVFGRFWSYSNIHNQMMALLYKENFNV